MLRQNANRSIAVRPCGIVGSVNTVHPAFQERPVDVPAFMLTYARSTIEEMKMGAARSFDDLIVTTRQTEQPKNHITKASIDNLLVKHPAKMNEGFVIPKVKKKAKKSATIRPKSSVSVTPEKQHKNSKNDMLMCYKLSPKVFGLPRPVSMSFENLSFASKVLNSDEKKEFADEFTNWGSLQNLSHSEPRKLANIRDEIISEPNLRTLEVSQ